MYIKQRPYIEIVKADYTETSAAWAHCSHASVATSENTLDHGRLMIVHVTDNFVR